MADGCMCAVWVSVSLKDFKGDKVAARRSPNEATTKMVFVRAAGP